MEWEQIQVVGALSQDFRRFASHIMLDDKAVGQELAVEATDDHDLIVSKLAHASALPCGQIAEDELRFRLQVQHIPSRRAGALELQALDSATVLLVRVLDAAEDVDELVVQVAAGMVVATFVDLG